jgi:hypothetical protein
MISSILDSRRHRILIGALIAASLVPVWAVEYFPSQNGPWHLLVSKMLRDYHDPALNYSAYYQHSWHAIPHLLHTVLVSVLSHVMPLMIANKVMISVNLILFPLSVFYLLSAIDRRQAILGYASFLFVYNGPLLRGYHDYSLGVPLVLLGFAYWWKNRDALSMKHRAVLATLAVLIYFSHIFNLGVLGLAIVLTTAWERRSIRAVLGTAWLFIVPAVLLAEYTWYTANQAKWFVESELVFMAPHRSAEWFFRSYFLTLSHTVYIATVGVLLAWSHLVFRGLASSWRRWKSGRAPAAVAFVLPVLLVVLTAMYFVAPYKFFGWHYVNVRFVPYVLVVALACAVKVGYRRGRTFAASMAVAAFACYAVLTYQFIRANDTIKEYVSGVGIVETDKTLLPVSFDSLEIGEVSPVAHAYDYYQIERGGANGRGIGTFNTLTPLVYRSGRTFPRLRLRGLDQLQAVSRAYDYVLLWGAPVRIIRQVNDAGLEVVHRQGRLIILQNRHRLSDAEREHILPPDGGN